MKAVDREIRADVADLLVRYASGIDRRDWALLRSCFTDDLVVRSGDGWRIARRTFTMVRLQMLGSK